MTLRKCAGLEAQYAPCCAEVVFDATPVWIECRMQPGLFPIVWTYGRVGRASMHGRTQNNEQPGTASTDYHAVTTHYRIGASRYYYAVINSIETTSMTFKCRLASLSRLAAFIQVVSTFSQLEASCTGFPALPIQSTWEPLVHLAARECASTEHYSPAASQPCVFCCNEQITTGRRCRDDRS